MAVRVLRVLRRRRPGSPAARVGDAGSSAYIEVRADQSSGKNLSSSALAR